MLCYADANIETAQSKTKKKKRQKKIYAGRRERERGEDEGEDETETEIETKKAEKKNVMNVNILRHTEPSDSQVSFACSGISPPSSPGSFLLSSPCFGLQTPSRASAPSA